MPNCVCLGVNACASAVYFSRWSVCCEKSQWGRNCINVALVKGGRESVRQFLWEPYRFTRLISFMYLQTTRNALSLKGGNTFKLPLFYSCRKSWMRKCCHHKARVDRRTCVFALCVCFALTDRSLICKSYTLQVRAKSHDMKLHCAIICWNIASLVL